MAGCKLQMASASMAGFGYNAWLQCLATSWKMALASMADCGFNALTLMPGYKLQKDSTSKAGCGINGLASMPGYELQSGFDFNGWLWLKWRSFKAWLRAAKWLRLQWLASAKMA